MDTNTDLESKTITLTILDNGSPSIEEPEPLEPGPTEEELFQDNKEEDLSMETMLSSESIETTPTKRLLSTQETERM